MYMLTHAYLTSGNSLMMTPVSCLWAPKNVPGQLARHQPFLWAAGFLQKDNDICKFLYGGWEQFVLKFPDDIGQGVHTYLCAYSYMCVLYLFRDPRSQGFMPMLSVPTQLVYIFRINAFLLRIDSSSLHMWGKPFTNWVYPSHGLFLLNIIETYLKGFKGSRETGFCLFVCVLVTKTKALLLYLTERCSFYMTVAHEAFELALCPAPCWESSVCRWYWN